jgi:hypothetical protein
MKLELNDQELDTVMRALSQAPYAAVAALIQNLVTQANAQRATAPPPVTE